jgi:small subunit ribosomal protein S5
MSESNVKRVKSSEIELKDRLVTVNRVTKVTKGGRAFTFAAIVVVGDESGVVGHGLGKAKEVTDAVQKGIDDAKKNLVKVPVLKGTVPHEAYGKFGGALVIPEACSSRNRSNRRRCYACRAGECRYP